MKYLFIPCFCLFTLFGITFNAFAMESSDCLDCHADADIVGEGLIINQITFDRTHHAEVGCNACHDGVSESHPDDGLDPGRANCGDCHSAAEEEYAKTTHSENVACVDCHNPHAVQAQAEVSGYDMNRPCATCHDGSTMLESHSDWLPRTSLHLSVLPCITCHTGSEKMVLQLYLSRPDSKTAGGDFQLASYEELNSLQKDSDPAQLLDLNNNHIVSLEELRTFNQNQDYQNFRLQGLLVPAVQTHSYDILYNRWDCTYCHGTGPTSLQTSYISLPQPDGSYQRTPVENGAVMTVLYTTPDFYMIGSTRNMALNLAGVFILAGGLVMPIGHGFVRFLTRRNRRHGDKS